MVNNCSSHFAEWGPRGPQLFNHFVQWVHVTPTVPLALSSGVQDPIVHLTLPSGPTWTPIVPLTLHSGVHVDPNCSPNLPSGVHMDTIVPLLYLVVDTWNPIVPHTLPSGVQDPNLSLHVAKWGSLRHQLFLSLCIVGTCGHQLFPSLCLVGFTWTLLFPSLCQVGDTWTPIVAHTWLRGVPLTLPSGRHVDPNCSPHLN